MSAFSCALCGGTSLYLFAEDRRRPYFRCRECALVQVPEPFYLSAAAEKAEYDKHDNGADTPGYRSFLSRTLIPVLARLTQGAEGLDFGCGAGAILSRMAAEQGFQFANYDLYYYPDKAALDRRYDCVTLTEVIEHVADAAGLMRQLQQLLKPGGLLAVMTKRVLNAEAFGRWHYKNDPTHINFYSDETFSWLAAELGWQLELVDKDVVFFRLPD
ncbi:class I SAM-dependent methyltransferase [Shewanella sedimentimangrovi]|uniref:Class I SAM-dependent methyltransferase n=1 Tax=Shewanella sedimentimangrovi TaxID=2814293 RepID=A0ABX7R010_9GAMM|nr:class I SAM-dependent methyltransferase [Shewanella sedimentimangrovi]QSX37111.1 class I SAM-dependent methyltransferase [Shewanella sedimentimangrovi]